MLRQFVNTFTTETLRPISFANWAYDPGASKRDLRLDILRGLFLCFMIIYHYHHTWMIQFTHEFFGTVSAAEGFVFISGMVVGLVYLPILQKQGFRAMSRRVGRRALHLYLSYVVLLLILILLHQFVFSLKPLTRSARSTAPFELVRDIVTLRFNPFGFDILLLYILLLLVTPLILWLVHTRRTLWLVIGSAALYVLYRVAPDTFSLQFANKEIWRFPFLIWQVLFVAGIVTIAYRAELVQLWQRLSKFQPALWVLVLFLGFFLLRQLLSFGIVRLPSATYDFWFDKNILGVGRLLNFVILALAIYWVVSRFWKPLARGPAKILIPLGQASLYVYMVHLLFSYLYRSAPAPLPLAGTGIYELATILFIWYLVRRRFLFQYVPH